VLDGTLTISGERVEEKEGLTADAAEEAEGHTAAAPGLEPGAAAEGVGPSDVPAPATNHTHSSVSKRAPLRYERSYGRFSRSFSLPPNVDVEGISASAQDGVLTVTIPKLPEQQPAAKDIQVQ
jgi:HSP20 family protein